MKKVNWNNLSKVEQGVILARPAQTATDRDFKAQVKAIVDQVKISGDKALLDYTEKFDHIRLTSLKVDEKTLETAYQEVSKPLLGAIDFAIKNIKTYHQAQLPKTITVKTQKGVTCQRQARPIQKVGLYVPGGSAPLLSTAMMLAIPARLANCPQIVVVSPPDSSGNLNKALLATLQRCGVQEIYKVGGAQAIAALGFGTESIPKTDKIFGPGNAFVTQAKLLVSEDPKGAAIDLPAGPSELLIIADHTASPDFVAADLLSQAEHGADSQVILISTSIDLLNKVEIYLKEQIALLRRRSIIEASLEKAAMIWVEDLNQAIGISNEYAPEHLILAVDQPEPFIPKIHAAGAVFVGHLTPETAGDYVTGSNHVLPTYGYAKTQSGLSVIDFMKFISIQTLSKQGFRTIAQAAEILAEIEGLTAHKNAVTIRRREML